jgi:uncharacterized protein (DUF3820 family)
VVTGVVLIALSNGMSMTQRFKHVILYGSISIALVVVNLIRNYNVSNTLTGIRQKGVTPLKENLQYYGEVICSWLPFSNLLSHYEWVVSIVFILSIMGIFIYRILKGIEHNSFEKIAVGFTIFYTLLILTTATLSKYETLNSRLLSPFYISFIFTFAFYGLYYARKIKSSIFLWMYKGIFFICFAFMLYQHVIIAKQNYYEVKDWGIGGYSEPSWKQSPIINHLKQDTSYFHADIPVFSNGSHVIYLFTKREVTIVPERTHQNKVRAFMDLPTYYLIWFNEEDNKEVFRLDELTQHRKVEKLKEFSDGAIYKLSQSAD